jgi:gamma-glutamyl phosphate reductase
MPDILTPAQVAECRERAERATEELDWGVLKTLASLCDDNADALAAIELHKHARTDIPALCATVEALREEQKELGDAFTRLVDIYEEGGETEFRPEWVRKALRARELSR